MHVFDVLEEGASREDSCEVDVGRAALIGRRNFRFKRAYFASGVLQLLLYPRKDAGRIVAMHSDTRWHSHFRPVSRPRKSDFCARWSWSR